MPHSYANVHVLVSGGGSTGARHLRNLRALGVRELSVAEPDAPRREWLADRFDARQVEDIADGLDAGPDVVLIATPPHLHVDQARLAVLSGAHVFVEKPLGIHLPGLDELAAEVADRRVRSMVSCHLRFHPLVMQAHELLQKGAIGELRFGRYNAGDWLPGRYPNSDFRRTWTTSPTMGGGAILDHVHELDLAVWMQGQIANTSTLACTLALDVEVEDYALLSNLHENGTASDVQMDYCQRNPERGLRLVGDKGTLVWEQRSRTLRLYEAKHDRWQVFDKPQNHHPNRVFVDQLRHFLEAVRHKRETTLSIPQAVHVTKAALIAKQSAANGCRMRLNDNESETVVE